MFFLRIIEWDWPDAPTRTPMFMGDLPKEDEPLPRFLDDGEFTRIMRAIAADPDPLRRLALEFLARTGMRASELCALERDAMVRIGDTHWLRIPIGKLHNDRYVPLHPHVVELIDTWHATTPADTTGRLLTKNGQPITRHVLGRMCRVIARRAGVAHLHPHRFRHTLATQAINRGMSLDAIAALLGHRSLDMTRRYARIANKTVAAEYARVTADVEALYDAPLDAATEGPTMRLLRAEHHRLLANGVCARPAQLDCRYESICETCAHFEPPWLGWRLLTLETRMESWDRRSRQVGRPRIGIRPRRRSGRCGRWSSCGRNSGPSTGRFSGSRTSSGSGRSRCGRGCARPTSMPARSRG